MTRSAALEVVGVLLPSPECKSSSALSQLKQVLKSAKLMLLHAALLRSCLPKMVTCLKTQPSTFGLAPALLMLGQDLAQTTADPGLVL